MGNEKPWKKKTIGVYKVELFKPKLVDFEDGKQARVRFDLNYEGEAKPTLKLFPEYGPKVTRYAKPEGLGRTWLEHEQSHVNDYKKILTKRQPPKSLTNVEYGEYMNHTTDLLKSCDKYHTDQRKRPNEPLWKECKKILGWK